MIEINKSEKEVISKRLPNTHIVRTMKQKSKRHHYYCEECKPVMKLLSEIRGGADNQKVGAKYEYRKKK